MKVRLVSYSKGTTIGLDDVKDLIAYCAKVSNPSGQMNMENINIGHHLKWLLLVLK